MISWLTPHFATVEDRLVCTDSLERLPPSGIQSTAAHVGALIKQVQSEILANSVNAYLNNRCIIYNI